MSNTKSSFLRLGRGTESVFTKIFRWAMIVAMSITFLLMLLTVSDITGRFVLNKPLPGTLEITESAMAFMVILAFAYTEAKGQNIRVDMLVNRFPERGRELANILSYLLGIFLFGMVFWGSWDHAMRSWQAREYTAGAILLPLYPSKFMVPVGAAFLIIQFIIELVRSIRKTIGKD